MIGVCRYCGCTNDDPCMTGMARRSVIMGGELAVGYFPCSWLLPDICDAPPCVEKAYMDARNSAEELTQLLEDGVRIEFEDVA